MMDQKLETQSNYSGYSNSESMAGTEDFVSSQPENNGRLEGRKKWKKVRPIRLHRLSSMKSSTRRENPQYDDLSILSSVSTESSGRSTSVEMSDASANYMKATSSSHAKESFQSSKTLFTRKTLTKLSTLKLKRSLTRKLSGGTELKMKLRPSRSIKLATAKSLRSTRQVKSQCNAGPLDLESICGSDGQDTSPSGYAGNKSQKVITRRLSLKPVRISTKISTLNSKKSSDSSLHEATCSSILKDSHFPDLIDLSQEGSGSSELSAVNICSYSYCSLHGRHRDDLPQLNHLVSTRRRLSNSQISGKREGRRPVSRPKHTGYATKAIQKIQTAHSEDDPVNKTAHPGRSHFQKRKELARDSNVRHRDTPVCTLTGVGVSGEFDGENTNLRYNAKKLLDEGAAEESTPRSAVMFSASDIGTLEGEAASKDRSMEPDNEVFRASSPQEESTKPSCNSDVASTVQDKDHKYIKMWQLVYKHAVLRNTGKGENMHSFNEKDKQGKGKDELPVNGANSSCQDSIETESDQDIDDQNKNVIELVRKAFDEILLPETEELSAVDHLKSRYIFPDEEVLEKSGSKSGKSNTSTSIESAMEETCLKVDNFRSHEEEITTQKLGAKPDRKSPKSWSNLKRFVKALEKVRNFHPGRLRHLPRDANLEAEKVHLRHQTAGEKKNAEEWMLDYALQKVISKLEPAQKQRVALLVEAIETFVPFQDAETETESFSTFLTQARPAKSLAGLSDHTNEETDKGMGYGYSGKALVEKVSSSDSSISKHADNASHKPTSEEHNPIVLTERSCHNDEKNQIVNDNAYPAEIKDPRSCSDVIAPTAEKVNKVNSISSLIAEISNGKSKSPGRDLETKNLIGVNEERFRASKSFILIGIMRSLGSDWNSLGAPPDLLDEQTTVGKERTAKAKLAAQTLEGFPIHEESEASENAVVSVVKPESQQEKQDYTGLWYLVYKHMVSSKETNDSKLVMDGEDGSKSMHNGSRTREACISHECIAVNKDNGVSDTEVELQKIEAIKMVEEAIDAIAPDVEDHLNRKEEDKVASRNVTTTEEQAEKPAPKEGSKPNQQLPTSWSNLKKVILLRRFIKALEKVREFNPRGPRYLPMEADPESEKVHLRHQEMAERKDKEEWMLDHALRQVVATLTPARKRKVALLVEAFETVMPSIKN